MENENLHSREINYKFWKDPKMMGMILLIIAVTLQIFSFIKVPVLSTINAYTIGMVLGSANPFFYVYISYIALTMIFKDSTKLPSWVKLTKISYWFVAISVVFIISSSGHYQSIQYPSKKNLWITLGTSNFEAMDHWFNKEFMSQPAWYPASSWGGALGAFLFSFFSMISSGVGAIILSIGLGVISLSVLITGTSVGLYKGMIRKKNLVRTKQAIEEKEEESFEEIKKKDAIAEEEENPFPFDDPFA